MVRFSICITTYQAARTIKASFESLFPQLDSRFEIVVVDSESTDGTLQFLKTLADARRIKLVVRKCTRGEGRQIAVETASADVLVQQVDVDQVYKPFFQAAAEYYEQEAMKDLDVVLMFVPRGETSLMEHVTSAKIPSQISFVGKKAFMSRTKWPSINRGEDLHVFDIFMKEGHYVEVNLSDYAEQLKGGLLRPLLIALSNQKQLMDSGFSFRSVLNSTRHHGLLFLARATMVCLAWIWHSLSRVQRFVANK